MVTTDRGTYLIAVLSCVRLRDNCLFRIGFEPDALTCSVQERQIAALPEWVSTRTHTHGLIYRYGNEAPANPGLQKPTRTHRIQIQAAYDAPSLIHVETPLQLRRADYSLLKSPP